LGVDLARTGLSKRLRAGFALAVLGVAAVSLAACGRNGPPELPPGPAFSSAYPPPAAAPPPVPAGPPATPGSAEDMREKQYEKAAQNGFDRSNNPVAPPSERRSFILDFLLQ
jgi:hypothetical protein